MLYSGLFCWAINFSKQHFQYPPFGKKINKKPEMMTSELFNKKAFSKKSRHEKMCTGNGNHVNGLRVTFLGNAKTKYY